WIEGHSIDGLGVFEIAEQFASVRVPKFDGAVVTRARQCLPLGIKGNAVDDASVSFETSEQFSSARVPELDRAVATPACQRPTVWIKGHAPDHFAVPL